MNILKSDRPQLCFSKASERYEASSDLQKRVGTDLIGWIPDGKPYGSILDIGMGTGWLTEKIGIKFPEARLFGVDFAPGMVSQAKGKNIDLVLQADAQVLPFKNEFFDLVVSNCAYQWVPDLKKAFCSSYRVLKDKGDFYFSCFGKNTLKELRRSLKAVSKDSLFRDSHWEIIDEKNIYNMLAASGFKNSEVQSEVVKIEFVDMLDLIRWLKAIGANQVKRNVFVGRNLLNKANIFYVKNYKDNKSVYASFEIIKARARK